MTTPSLVERLAAGLFEKYRIEECEPPEITFQEHAVHDDLHQFYLDAVTLLLSEIEKAGWVVVPREPTEEMLDAGTAVDVRDPDGWSTCAYELEEIWPAMIAASPKV